MGEGEVVPASLEVFSSELISHSVLNFSFNEARELLIKSDSFVRDQHDENEKVVM
jgi:hypothetical protein